MSLKPTREEMIRLEGNLAFDASYEDIGVQDEFTIRMLLPTDYPSHPPLVEETGGRIPKHEDFHVNPDGSLCLGSDVAIKEVLHEHLSLLEFIDRFVVSFLLNASIKLKQGGPFVTGELPHGHLGLVADYKRRFDLNSENQVYKALHLLSLRKRTANKQPCPCGCGCRLANCRFGRTLNRYREIAPRSWFAAQARKVRPFTQ